MAKHPRLTRRQRDAEPLSTLTDAEIERLAAIHLHQLLEEDEEARIFGLGDETVYETVRQQLEKIGVTETASDIPWFGQRDRMFRRNAEGLDIVQPTLKAALARGDTSLVEDEVDDLLDWNSIRLDKGSMVYRKLVYAILRVSV